MNRDRRLELELLERVEAESGFADQVLARLGHTEATKGNDGWERPVDELLQEILEECADITGWGLGAAHQLEEPERHRLVVAMRLGAVAWREIEELREVLATRRETAYNDETGSG